MNSSLKLILIEAKSLTCNSFNVDCEIITYLPISPSWFLPNGKLLGLHPQFQCRPAVNSKIQRINRVLMLVIVLTWSELCIKQSQSLLTWKSASISSLFSDILPPRILHNEYLIVTFISTVTNFYYWKKINNKSDKFKYGKVCSLCSLTEIQPRRTDYLLCSCLRARAIHALAKINYG